MRWNFGQSESGEFSRTAMQTLLVFIGHMTYLPVGTSSLRHDEAGSTGGPVALLNSSKVCHSEVWHPKFLSEFADYHNIIQWKRCHFAIVLQ